ncbi:NAD(P)/FAD-dependent oxidoreductase [Actinomyces minihominis]|uniref:NAD(P)/FAD-dependent oxidoreductase n=1 Tax=Actinomyces minihominis TaxID=2002838 RepID=UPI000C08349E|nr:NAD(P)/FAD-dependent oxidoreductase [Actinomyces minihominis]
MAKHRVVIIGSGFGGLFSARYLAKSDVQVTLISKVSHHLFQPLLYQVATGILSQGEIAPATREILKRQRNAQVNLGTVEDIDPDKKVVYWRNYGRQKVTPYDTLIIAAGVGQSYFGNDHFSTFAPGMKTIDDALELRARIFAAFEQAEVEEDPEKVKQLLTFVVVGAGPTGVEMAGQIRELAVHTLKREFRNINPSDTRVLLVEGGPQPLPTFGKELGQKTVEALDQLGVEFRGNTLVVDIDADSVTMKNKVGNTEVLPSTCKVWAAGVQGPALAKVLAERTGVELDRVGRVRVKPDLTVEGYRDIFVIGDMMSIEGVPGVAQGAIQAARFTTDVVKARLAGISPRRTTFGYRDRGSMATIARSEAVASVGDVQMDGFPAWVAWLGLHIFYITGFKSRVSTLFHWGVSFASQARAERTTTNQQLVGRLAIAELGRGGSTRLIEGDTPQEVFADAQTDLERQIEDGIAEGIRREGA